MTLNCLCPHCRRELWFEGLPADAAACPHCRAPLGLRITPAMRQDNVVDRCAVCDCQAVYVQKDFNRTLGVTIFAAGALVSLVLYGFNLVWQAFGVLLACALVDALLYKVLPEVTICYQCHAQYRGFATNPQNRAFELGLAEKFDPLDKRREAENPAAAWKGR